MQKRSVRQPRKRPKASTEDVVGKSRGRIRPAWRKYYDRLTELRDAIRGRQSDLTKDALEENPKFGTHLADAGTDSYDRDFALGLLSSEQDAFYEIEEALDRIRNRTYGICELTGQPIEPSRLEAIPWTRFSAAAEKQLEREGAARHPRLGRRHSVSDTRLRGPEEA
jgi:DnaK suppressor protein